MIKQAQNCPFCGNSPIEDLTPMGLKTSCNTIACDFYSRSVSLETWNRLRMAPDGKEVKLYEHFIGSVPVEAPALGDWMNPRYPKDTNAKQNKTD